MVGGGEEQRSAHRIWLRKETNKTMQITIKVATDISKIKTHSQIPIF